MKRNSYSHSVEVVANVRIENRFVGKPRDFFHFRQMLVFLRERVFSRRFQFKIALRIFVLRDGFFSRAAVSRNRVAYHRIIRRNNSTLNERIDERDKAACVAAWNGYALRGNYFLSEFRAEFWKAIRPVGIRPVRRGSVDDFCFGIRTKRDGLDCCGIGQTQKREVRSVYAFGARGIVLALFFVNQNQFDVAAIFESLENLETGCSFFSVDENFVHKSSIE